MDILHLVDSRGIGGIETHIRVTATALKRAGHTMRVVFLKRYGQPHPLEAVLKAEGVDVLYADEAGGLWTILWAKRPTLLHSHGYKANLMARGLCKVLRIATVASFHAGERATGKLRIYTSLDRWTSLIGTKIAVSQTIAQTLPGSSTVLGNFIDMPIDSAPIAGNRIAFIGRLSHEKAPERFCAMAARLPHLQADIYGDGPMRAHLEARYRNQIRFHGMVSNIAMRLMGTDLVVMPSRQEGLPMTALEAMGHGVPVAATDVGGLSTLIDDGHNGYLVPAKTPFSLEKRIATFFSLSITQRREMGHRARSTIQERFSTDSQIPKLVEIYRQVASQKGPLNALAA